VSDLTRERAPAVRVGNGDGEQVADGRWAEALSLPPRRGPGRRDSALRPTAWAPHGDLERRIAELRELRSAAEAAADAALQRALDDATRPLRTSSASGGLEAALDLDSIDREWWQGARG
jgi:hypothetical protein